MMSVLERGGTFHHVEETSAKRVLLESMVASGAIPVTRQSNTQ